MTNPQKLITEMTRDELREAVGEWREIGTTAEGGRLFVAPLGTPEPTPLPKVRTTRFRDRLARGEMIVKTPNGRGGFAPKRDW